MKALARIPDSRTRPAVGACLLALAAAAGVAAAGCSGQQAPLPPTVTVTAISVSTVTVAPSAVPTSSEDPNLPPAGTAPPADTVAPTEPGPADVSLDPCALVSKAEAEALAGTPLDPPAAAKESCVYTGPVTGPLGQVEVYVGDGAQKFLDVERTLQHELRTLDGVADETYLGESNAFIRKGFTWVAIQLVRLNDPAENAGPLEDLTRTVAGRLP